MIISLVLVICTPALLAKRDRASRRQGQAERQSLKACQWAFEECKFPEGKTCGVGTKQGKAQNDECPIREKEFKCRVSCGCRYKPVAGQSATCDPTTSTKTLQLELVSGDPAKCAATSTKTRRCRARSPRDANRRAERRRERLNAGGEDAAATGEEACRYRRGQKSECDPTTLKRTITLELKKKSPATCPPTKTITKDCKVKGSGGRGGGGGGRRNNRRRQNNDD